MTRSHELHHLPFETDTGFGPRARIGLIVLESDRTIETELRMLNIDGVGFHHARIPMESDVTPATLTGMGERLPVAAALLPREFAFDAIGYACTSAATLIGEDAVTAAIRTAHPTVACSNPITAAVAAFDALGVRRIGVVTPYTADVTTPIVDHFSRHGLDVVAAGSFLEPSDLVVACITEESIANGVRHVAASDSCDAVFVSCTSLRTLRILETLEEQIGVPVVSSNQAFFWHLLRLAGVEDGFAGFGSLFGQPLPRR